MPATRHRSLEQKCHLGCRLESMCASSLSLRAPEGSAWLLVSALSLPLESLSLLCLSLLPSSLLLPAQQAFSHAANSAT